MQYLKKGIKFLKKYTTTGFALCQISVEKNIQIHNLSICPRAISIKYKKFTIKNTYTSNFQFASANIKKIFFF